MDDKLENVVFYFFNESKYKIKNNKKHKLVENNFVIQNELTNCKKLVNEVSNVRNHFYLFEHYSNVNLAKIDENDNQLTNDNTILIEFNDIEIINFKKYLISLCPKRYILKIIESYIHLLDTIELLVTNKIFHNNINFNNIIVDKLEYVLLSNFEFSIDYSDKNKNINNNIKYFITEYDPSYIEWPIELHILSYLLTNQLLSLSSFNIETIISEYINNNIILNTFGSTIVSSYKEEAIIYFNKYVNQSYDFILKDVITNINTWDNYALSMLFLKILIGIHKSIKIKNKFIILFMKLLVKNIHLNPLSRLSIDNTKKEFNSLLDNLEPIHYNEIIKLMSA